MSRAFPKRPEHPREPLRRTDADLWRGRPVLWRIHRTTGDHVLPWSRLRHWGPAATARFDPHPPPPREHDDVGVLYAATDVSTALAETFQHQRVIDTVGGAPRATSWQPARDLRLLDLTEDWALHNGASHSLASGPRATCRAWARAIAETWPGLDGLRSQSTLTGRVNVTLWSPAADSFPSHPDFSEPLSADEMWTLCRQVTRRYPTYIVR